MTAKRLDGKLLAQTIRAEIAAKVTARTARGKTPPGLAVVLVGENEASHSYVRNKQKACGEVGIRSWLHHLPVETKQDKLDDLLEELNDNDAVHGILVQLPLPPHINEEFVTRVIDIHKDVDAFHPQNIGLLAIGQPRYYPCTPFGCIQLLRRNGIELAGREVVIVGRSNIVGKPLALMMMQRATKENLAGCDATVTVAHTQTADLGAMCRRADVLIAAAGKAGLITANMVKPGATVIDVGTNPVNGKLVGDVAPDVWAVARAVSPVPGGVGPMTITMLLDNTLRAAQFIDG